MNISLAIGEEGEKRAEFGSEYFNREEGEKSEEERGRETYFGPLGDDGVC